MRTALRIASLSFLLAAGAPAVALAAPNKAPPAQHAPAKHEGGSAAGVLVLLGVVVVGGGGFVAWRALSGSRAGKGDGRPPEPIVPERKHDWESRLTEPQEAAMLRGIQAYRDGGHSLYVGQDNALIIFYGRRMLVSLHRVTDAFLAAGQAAVDEPVGAMRTMLDGFAAAESQGVLHLRTDWYAPPVDGKDASAFTSLCHDLLTCPKPYIEGTQGSSSDDNCGSVTVNVQVGGPLNTFCVDLGRALAPIHAARVARPADPIADVIRPVLQGMVRGEIPGGMWTRGSATPAEVDLLVRILATSVPRAA